MSEYIPCIKCSKLITMNKTETCLDCRTINCEKCGVSVKKYTSVHIKLCGSCKSTVRSKKRSTNHLSEGLIYL